MSTGGASVGGLLDSRVLLTIGGLLAIEL
jgi:hypothetical protein